MNHAALARDLAIVRDGLPARHGKRHRVIVVGAGMAGLAAAHELLRAGHDPLVLEARGRAGGRIYTMREPFAPGLYGEAGAMRIPRSHQLTLAYVQAFGLSVKPFTMHNPNAYCHLFGRKMRLSEFERNPELLGSELAEHDRGLTSGARFEALMKPFAEKIERDGEPGWAEIAARYDGYSTREFLEEAGWSEAAIELYGLVCNQEAIINACFLELLREEVGRFYTDMVRIDGGSDQLPNAFLSGLRDRVRFGARMIAIDQSERDVTVHYRTAAGRRQASADYAIVTVPFPVLRHVEALKPFSHAKRRAIRQLRYDASAKIFFQCARRFWEVDDGIFGGGTVTDLPVRNVYYPESGRATGRGVLLASYTWSEDAQRWGSLPPDERIEQALEDLAQIHPQVVECFEVGASWMWHDDPFAGGAYALFEPSQQRLLHEHIIAPEGRIHFAGEHASLAHAWIQGAIESGLRAAREIHAHAA
ncbi:MAG TPA: FAD-dependent oxidoreductase [Casimicrobiaceae bacterium]|nr:FAD-dependent oxidoreductase [Casimicrobiaceae bacterium]